MRCPAFPSQQNQPADCPTLCRQLKGRMNNNAPIALNAYETLAEAYAAKAETKAENGYNEHPAIRSVIGSARGPRVLDAGSGPGFLSRDLLEGGA